MDDFDGGTRGPDYTGRLDRLSGARWKRLLNVQAPYRWNLRRLLGGAPVLDVGCGIGRNLLSLPQGSLGVDHNPTSVEACHDAGLDAETVEVFLARRPQDVVPFGGLLAAHLLEHLPEGTAAATLAPYLPYLAPAATVVMICPQERGFASDETHTVFLDHDAMAACARELGLEARRQFSFPLPRAAGRIFTYNELVTEARLPA